MAEIAITQAAFAGFGILRRKPWAPLAWSLLYAGILGGLVVCLGGAFIQAVGKMITLRSAGATQFANYITAQAFFGQTPAQVWRQLEPFIVLYIVLIWIGSIVLFPLFLAWPEVYRQLKGGELAATFS